MSVPGVCVRVPGVCMSVPGVCVRVPGVCMCTSCMMMMMCTCITILAITLHPSPHNPNHTQTPTQSHPHPTPPSPTHHPNHPQADVPPPAGFAIQARVTSEDVERNFTPDTGRIQVCFGVSGCTQVFLFVLVDINIYSTHTYMYTTRRMSANVPLHLHK